MTHIDYEKQIQPGTRSEYYQLWKEKGIALLSKYNPPAGQRILDLGCGRGETMELCRQAGYIAVGADIDPVCIDKSRKFGKVYLLSHEPLCQQFGERSYDSIVCFHVLEHVENPKDYLCNMSKIARKFIVVAVPNLRTLSRIFCRNIDITHFKEGHLQSWDHWHFLNLCERHCGLSLVEWAHDATMLPGNYMLDRLIGERNTVRLEKGLFRKAFPFHCNSIIGIFSVGS